ncbi:MAG: hypothetical protein ACP5QO_15690, partial [Clostridia bacterium]
PADANPPRSGRSPVPSGPGATHATSDPRAPEPMAAIVLVETRNSIDGLEAVIATEGVTAVEVGPSDLSLALGA